MSYSSSSYSDSDDEDWDDWKSEMENEPLISFLGSHTLPTAAAVWDELKEACNIDIPALIKSRNLREYDLVRIVNALRSVSYGLPVENVVSSIKSAVEGGLLQEQSTIWSDEKYLLPVIEGDALVMAVFENEDSEFDEGIDNKNVIISNANIANSSNIDGFQDHTSIIESLMKELALAKSIVARYTSTEIGEEETKPEQTKDYEPLADHGGVNKADNDTYYFESYANYGIHADMLDDRVRTEAYRSAILENPQYFTGKTVLDVGCGTGILSMFSADAGAKRVYGLDASGIIEKAKQIVAANKKDKIVTCVRGKAESFKPSHPEDDGKVDIIISEWMGYALSFESMLTSVIKVRDQVLKPGGRMFPSRSRVLIGAVSSPSLWNRRIGHWRDVYGYDMSVMVPLVDIEALVTTLEPTSLASSVPYPRDSNTSSTSGPPKWISTSYRSGNPKETKVLSRFNQRSEKFQFADVNVMRDYNMNTMLAEDLDIVNEPFRFCVDAKTASSDGIHGILIWFDIDFDDSIYPGIEYIKQLREKKETPRDSADSSCDADDLDDMPPLESTLTSPTTPITEGDASVDLVNNNIRENKNDPKLRSFDPHTHVHFCTGPQVQDTHWHQTLLTFTEPIRLDAGVTSSDYVVLGGTFNMLRDATNPRTYNFTVECSLTGQSKVYKQSWKLD